MDIQKIAVIVQKALENDDIRRAINLLKEREDAVSVFTAYRNVILHYFNEMAIELPEETLSRAGEILATVDENLVLFKQGTISETRLIEDTLWPCLEAIVIIEVYIVGIGEFEIEDVKKIDALSSLAFHQFRERIYEQERDAVAEFLKYQEILDEELAQKLRNCIDELDAKLDLYDQMAEKAFSEDIEIALQGSIDLAKAEGVDSKEILVSFSDLDDIMG